MARQVQLRRGTTAENALFVGAQAELVVDTEQNKLILHDGVTVGGHKIATEDYVRSHPIVGPRGLTGQGITDAPLSSVGQAGDSYGLIAMDENNLYFCIGDFDGTTQIWRKYPIVGSTW